MFKSLSTVLIWSEDYKKLAKWYEKVLGLKVTGGLNHPDDTGVLFGFDSGETDLWIGQHDKVKGGNKDMHRFMFNIKVDSVTATYNLLKIKGVKFLAIPFKAPTLPYFFATFYDLDNNLVQLVGGE